MIEVEEECATKIQVLCAWCGTEIREGDEPEWSGMCQACFRQMVDEHLRLATRSQEHASER
jgi:NMD protein affecting ribosome stability and mRNA decay